MYLALAMRLVRPLAFWNEVSIKPRRRAFIFASSGRFVCIQFIHCLKAMLQLTFRLRTSKKQQALDARRVMPHPGRRVQLASTVNFRVMKKDIFS